MFGYRSGLAWVGISQGANVFRVVFANLAEAVCCVSWQSADELHPYARIKDARIKAERHVSDNRNG